MAIQSKKYLDAKKAAVSLNAYRTELASLVSKAKSKDGLSAVQERRMRKLVHNINISKAKIVNAGFDPNTAAVGAKLLRKKTLKKKKIKGSGRKSGGAGVYGLGSKTKIWK